LSLGVFMRDRSTSSIVIALAVVLGLSTLLWYWIAPPPKVKDFVGPPRSGYTLKNFTLDSYAETGKPAYRLSAPQLEQREGDDSIYINRPDFILHSATPGMPDWTGKSDYGWVDKPGTLMKLQGKVEMHRPAFADQAAADMFTSEVTAWPKQSRMETAEAVRAIQGPSTMTGIGMRANLDSKHLEVLNDFHGTFPPSKKR
jgi:lipopolysaccharide export system protein LptC